MPPAQATREIELRVHGNCHVSPQELQRHCEEIKRKVEARASNCCLQHVLRRERTGGDRRDDRICSRTGVKYFRVMLPLAGVAAVRNRGSERTVVPSIARQGGAGPAAQLAGHAAAPRPRRTKLAGVCALLEIHWGTVMSSCTSAHSLVRDLDPDAIAITFDPANMIIEGKEDWDYGIELLREHLANVHIKNVSWVREAGNWTWQWDGLQQGWSSGRTCSVCSPRGSYRGMLAMEDFLVPRTYAAALEHLTALRREATLLLDQGSSRRAA